MNPFESPRRLDLTLIYEEIRFSVMDTIWGCLGSLLSIYLIHSYHLGVSLEIEEFPMASSEGHFFLGLLLDCCQNRGN